MHSLIFGNPDFQKLRQVEEMAQGLTALAALREDPGLGLSIYMLGPRHL